MAKINKNSDSTSEVSSESIQQQSPNAVPVSADNPSLHIILHKLTSRNFLQWSRFVTLFLRGKGRLSYLIGETKALATTDLDF